MQDRAIYRNPSRLAYVGSLFLHSWDESVAFWETDRKAIIGEFCFLALGAMVWSLIKGWEYTLNEVLLGIAVTAGPPVAAAIGLYAWGVLKAPYSLHGRLLATNRLQRMTATIEPLPKQPRVKLSAVLIAEHHMTVTFLVAENFGEIVAVNVAAIIRIPHTKREIRFKCSHIGPGTATTPMIPELYVNDMPAPEAKEVWPIEKFLRNARREAIVGRAADLVHSNPDRTKAEMQEWSDSFADVINAPIGFDVSYTDFDGLEYHTEHILSYTQHEILGVYGTAPDIQIDLVRGPVP